MRIAVYAGSFDPVTRGHLSVVERAARTFDLLFVVVADNPAKRSLLTAGERVSLLHECSCQLENVEVAQTDGLVVELARQVNARFLVRGVRGVTDIEAEISLANVNHQLAPEITTFFVPADPALSEVSSSRLKQLAEAGADLSELCTPNVARALSAKLARRGSLGAL